MTIATLAFATGMRGEEFLALKWSDIDFDARSISVSQASVRQHRKDEDGGKKWERGIGQVKTKSSVRVLYFGETLKQLLLSWKNEVEASAEYKKALRTGNADYLFLDAHGQLANVDYLRNNFHNHFARREFIDRPITFHMFRHSYATWAKSNGVEPFVIKSWMGHSMKGNITEDVYTSVTKEMADTAVGIMDAFLAELIAEAKKLGTIEEPNGRNGKKRKA